MKCLTCYIIPSILIGVSLSIILYLIIYNIVKKSQNHEIYNDNPPSKFWVTPENCISSLPQASQINS